jgi:hypothetical protein
LPACPAFVNISFPAWILPEAARELAFFAQPADNPWDYFEYGADNGY